VTQVFTEEHDELGGVVREFLTEFSAEDEVRRLMVTTEGFDPKVWSRLADLGLTGLAIPTELGGAGAGPVEVGVVLEQAGQALLCAPYLSTVVLATTALLASDDETVQQELLPDIATGAARATLAHADHAAPQITARAAGADWTLDGSVSFVLDGHTADTLLIPAVGPDGIDVFIAAADAAGLVRQPLATLDLTRKQAELTFQGVPARRLGDPGSGPRILRRVLRTATLTLAAEQTGGAQRVLDLSVEHVRTRVQFGRPIGSFQAVKHHCADMLIRVESARSAAYQGLAELAAENTAAADLDITAAVAGSYCSEAFLACAAEAIQLHGGIGFTWEHPVQLYFKRARTSYLLFGDPREYRRELAATLTEQFSPG
jgi:alkylation response protein AidB-like acyl-CoA dehydrogenase